MLATIGSKGRFAREMLTCPWVPKPASQFPTFGGFESDCAITLMSVQKFSQVPELRHRPFWSSERLTGVLGPVVEEPEADVSDTTAVPQDRSRFARDTVWRCLRGAGLSFKKMRAGG